MINIRKSSLMLAAAALCVATVAQARPYTPDMTCGEAANTVSVNGAIVMDTGPNTYDRFVVSRAYCTPHEIVKIAYANTVNNSHCQVGYTCESQESRGKK